MDKIAVAYFCMQVVSFVASIIAISLSWTVRKEIIALKKADIAETAIRKQQDWKLYNLVKSNFNVLARKKLKVEEKVEEDDFQNEI